MRSRTVDTGTASLRAEVVGRLGRLTLARPEALNALTRPMIHAMHRVLRAWQSDPEVRTIWLDGEGERAFCAGGDVGVVRKSALGDGTEARALWRHEYALDLRIARYPKPVVTILDGLVLGGGVGLVAHRRYRVATEYTSWGMPEVRIGLAPDVGGLLRLARLPGELGTHLALTGGRVDSAACMAFGLTDVFVPRQQLVDLRRSLRGDDAPSVLAAIPPVVPTARHHPVWIDRCYRGTDAELILDRLQAETDPAARSAADAIASASPTAVKVTLVALRRAALMRDLAECLRQDYRLSTAFLRHPDLVEGIRAVVVDKDGDPRWTPARLAEVTDAQVGAFFDEEPAY